MGKTTEYTSNEFEKYMYFLHQKYKSQLRKQYSDVII